MAKFSCRKLTGRVLATNQEVLAEAARRMGLHPLVNLAGRIDLPAPRKLALDG